MPMGLAANTCHAESRGHLLNPAAIARSSREIPSETIAESRFMPGAFNQAADAAVIR